MPKIIYPYLPEGREIKYVSLDNKFMEEAKSVRDKMSTETMNPTGAVIVKNGLVVARGANQSKLKPDSFLFNLHKKKCIRRMLKIKTGTKYWLCPGCATHKEHAESRAVADAIKNGVNAQGADLYLYGHWWCCEPCWKSMIEAGVKDVYLLDGSEVLFARENKNSMIEKK